MIICKQEKYNKKKNPTKKKMFTYSNTAEAMWFPMSSKTAEPNNQFTAELFLHWDQAHRNEEFKKNNAEKQ